MTQGGTLSVISYVICILPLICDLLAAHPHIMQTWYAENTGVGGTFDALHKHMKDILVKGTLRE